MLATSSMVLAGNAINGGITHMQLHSGARGASGTTNAIGTREPVEGVVQADGSIVWSNIDFDGLNANQPVAEVSYWSAATDGTYRGGAVLSGDTQANAAGQYRVVQVTETAQTPS